MSTTGTIPTQLPPDVLAKAQTAIGIIPATPPPNNVPSQLPPDVLAKAQTAIGINAAAATRMTPLPPRVSARPNILQSIGNGFNKVGDYEGTQFTDIANAEKGLAQGLVTGIKGAGEAVYNSLADAGTGIANMMGAKIPAGKYRISDPETEAAMQYQNMGPQAGVRAIAGELLQHPFTAAADAAMYEMPSPNEMAGEVPSAVSHIAHLPDAIKAAPQAIRDFINTPTEPTGRPVIPGRAGTGAKTLPNANPRNAMPPAKTMPGTGTATDVLKSTPTSDLVNAMVNEGHIAPHQVPAITAKIEAARANLAPETVTSPSSEEPAITAAKFTAAAQHGHPVALETSHDVAHAIVETGAIKPEDAEAVRTGIIEPTLNHLAAQDNITPSEWLQKNVKGIVPGHPIEAATAEGQKIVDAIHGTPAQPPASQMPGNPVPAETQAMPKSPVDINAAAEYAKVPTSSINVDPQRFQYKLLSGKGGQTGSLSDVSAWNPISAGAIDAWRDPSNGLTYAINGHNRLALANRLNVPNVNVRYLDAPDAASARALGAIANISEGQGTPVDAAQFFRDSKMTPQDAAAAGIPIKGKLAEQGLALSNLADPIFSKVRTGEMPTDQAVAIGKNVQDAGDQMTVMKLVDKAQQQGKKIDAALVSEIAQSVNSAPKIEGSTSNLFGDDQPQSQNLAIERAGVARYITQTLAQDGRIFGGAARNADRLGTVEGNRIDPEKSGAIADQAKTGSQLFDANKNYTGPVSDILDAAARRIGKGEKPNVVQREAYKQFLDLAPQLAKGDLGARLPGAAEDAGTARAGNDAGGSVRPQQSGQVQTPTDERDELTGVLYQRAPQGSMFGDDPNDLELVPQKAKTEAASHTGGTNAYTGSLKFGDAVHHFEDNEKVPPLFRNLIAHAQTEKDGSLSAAGKAKGLFRTKENGKYVDYTGEATIHHMQLNARAGYGQVYHAPNGDITYVLNENGSTLTGIVSGNGSTRVYVRDDGAKSSDSEYSSTLFQKSGQESAPTFFSQAERVIQSKMGARMPADQLEKTLLANGVKPDEMKWSGLDDLIAKRKTTKAPITKQEALDHLAANNVQMEEVHKGANKLQPEKIAPLEWRQSSAYQWKSTAPDGHTVVIDHTPGYAYGYDATNGRYTDAHDTLDAAKAWIQHSIERETADKLNAKNLPKFDQYQLPGGKNYREMLLTAPNIGGAKPLEWRQAGSQLSIAPQMDGSFATIEHHGNGTYTATQGQDGRTYKSLEEAKDWAQRSVNFKYKDNGRYRSSHWDEPNVLAHIRMNDRTGPNGEKVLHVEEIQSDWHQAGRKSGYSTSPNRGNYEIRPGEDPGSLIVFDKEKDSAIWSGSNRERAQQVINERVANANAIQDSNRVPSAPFSKTWHELALKRVLRHAAENGYDRVSWTGGEDQNARYDLSKHISEVSYLPEKQLLSAKDHDGKTVMTKGDVAPGNLSDHIGKEVADRLINNPSHKNATPNGTAHVVSGLDLKIGGSGMKGFYDKIVPDYLNKYGKKWGAQVEPTTINLRDPIDNSYTVDDEDGRSHSFTDYDTAHSFARANGTKVELDESSATKTVQSLPITDAMRKSVMEEGQPLFQKPSPTDTPEFNRWFKNSKAVDEQGKPLVAYHGTGKVGHSVFDTTNYEGNDDLLYGSGAYFTNSPETASGYAGTAKGRITDDDLAAHYKEGNIVRAYGEGSDRILKTYDPDTGHVTGIRVDKNGEPIQGERPRTYRVSSPDQSQRAEILKSAGKGPGVYPVYLSIQNPLDIDGTIKQSEYATIRAAAKAHADQYGDDNPLNRTMGEGLTGKQVYEQLSHAFDKTDARNILESAGYDGITHVGGAITGNEPHRVFIAFKPEQIKSAIGNNGEFDPNNPSILKQHGPSGEKGSITNVDASGKSIPWSRKDGQALIKIYKAGDFSTAAHEWAHLMRKSLSGDLLSTVEDHYGVKGEWTEDHEERFARDFERYLAEGNAPTQKLQSAFDAFKSWMAKIYAGTKGSPLEQQLSPQMREVFDKIYGGREEGKLTNEQVAAAKAGTPDMFDGEVKSSAKDGGINPNGPEYAASTNLDRMGFGDDEARKDIIRRAVDEIASNSHYPKSINQQTIQEGADALGLTADKIGRWKDAEIPQGMNRPLALKALRDQLHQATTDLHEAEEQHAADPSLAHAQAIKKARDSFDKINIVYNKNAREWGQSGHAFMADADVLSDAQRKASERAERFAQVPNTKFVTKTTVKRVVSDADYQAAKAALLQKPMTESTGSLHQMPSEPAKVDALTKIGMYHYENIKGGDYNEWAAKMKEDAPGLDSGDIAQVRSSVLDELAKAKQPAAARMRSEIAFPDQLGKELGKQQARDFINTLAIEHPGALNKIMDGRHDDLTPEERSTISSLFEAHKPASRRGAPSENAVSVVKKIVSDTRTRKPRLPATRKPGLPANTVQRAITARVGANGYKALQERAASDKELSSSLSKLGTGQELTDSEVRNLQQHIDAVKPVRKPPTQQPISKRMTDMAKDVKAGRIGYSDSVAVVRHILTTALAEKPEELKAALADVAKAAVEKPGDVHHLANTFNKHVTPGWTKGGAMTKMKYAIRSGLLSGPRTLVQVALGHSLASSFEEGIVNPVTSLISGGKLSNAHPSDTMSGLKTGAKSLPESLRIIKEGVTAHELRGLAPRHRISDLPGRQLSREPLSNALGVRLPLRIHAALFHPFGEMAEHTATIRYARLWAQRFGGDYADYLKDPDVKAAAKKMAAEQIFQNENAGAKAVKAANDAFDRHTGTKIGSFIGATQTPFVTTPLNIAGRGLEYSGPGAVYKGLHYAGMKMSGKFDKMSENDQFLFKQNVARSTARAIVGTGLGVIGAALTAKGILNPPNAAKHEYGSINFGGKRYDIDRLAPVATPLEMGGEDYLYLRGKDADFLAPMADSPFSNLFQEAQDVKEGQSQGGKKFSKVVAQTTGAALSVAVPTLFSQVASSTDPSGMVRVKKGVLDASMNRIPFLREKLATGKYRQSSNVKNNGVLSTLLYPGQVESGK